MGEEEDNGHPRGGYVTYDWYVGQHARLRDQTIAVREWAREQLEGLRDRNREEHHDIETRIEALEDAEEKRKERRWTLALTLLAGLLLPLIVAAVLAYTAAHGH